MRCSDVANGIQKPGPVDGVIPRNRINEKVRPVFFFILWRRLVRPQIFDCSVESVRPDTYSGSLLDPDLVVFERIELGEIGDDRL
jgi:hypothetical protein